jgi:Transposase DDE domain
VIVDVEATAARTYDEVAATQTMLDRTQERFGLKPRRLAADTAYGTGKFLGWLVKEKKIIPHIPVWEKSDRQDGIFSRSDLRWDRKRGAYICPNGKLLRTSGTVHDGRTLLYRASKRDCDVCPIRAKCCTTADARKIPRAIHEDARDVARRKMKTIARSRDERKRVEMRFAHLKTHPGHVVSQERDTRCMAGCCPLSTIRSTSPAPNTTEEYQCLAGLSPAVANRALGQANVVFRQVGSWGS